MIDNKFHLYRKDKSKNYLYIDRVVENNIEMGGFIVHVYPWLAVIDKNGVEQPITETSVSDPVLMENTKRKYSKVTYDLWTWGLMPTPKFSFSFEGLSILDGDEKELIFHYNEMVSQLGRKLIIGDVLELSIMRDLDVLGYDKAVNKFYVVTDSVREEKGWGPEWHYHLWKIKMKPIINSPEYEDLFNDGEDGDNNHGFLEDLDSPNGGGGMDINNSSDKTLDDIDDKVNDEAEAYDEDEKYQGVGVSYRLHNEHHAYLENETTQWKDNRLIISDIDGIANSVNCSDIPYGDKFPDPKSDEAADGRYFLRIDYAVPKLYKREVETVYEYNLYSTSVPELNGVLELNEKNILFDGNVYDKNGYQTAYILNNAIYLTNPMNKQIGYVNENGTLLDMDKDDIGSVTSQIIAKRGKWSIIGLDFREKWTGCPMVLRGIINNENEFENESGETVKMRQNIKELVPARVSKSYQNIKPWNKSRQEKIESETGIKYDIIGVKKP